MAGESLRPLRRRPHVAGDDGVADGVVQLFVLELQDDGEPGLPDWKIIATGPGGTTYTATTDIYGNYCLSVFGGGEYIVSEQPRDDWDQTFPADEEPHTLMVPPSQSGVDFGNCTDCGEELICFEVCGTKFNDLNGNGAREANEPGLANWTIGATGNAGTFTAVTADDGSYCMLVLADAQLQLYQLFEQQQTGWVQTFPTVPTKVVSSLPNVLTGFDFGNHCPTCPVIIIGDANADGVVNSIDATLILQFSAGLLDALENETNADTNGDGTISSVDALLVLQFVAGLLPAL